MVGCDGVAPRRPRGLRLVKTSAVEFLDEPVQKLFDHDRSHVEQAVYTAAPNNEETEVAESVEMHEVVFALLTHDVIAEADRRERDEAEVDGLKVRPVLHWVVPAVQINELIVRRQATFDAGSSPGTRVQLPRTCWISCAHKICAGLGRSLPRSDAELS